MAMRILTRIRTTSMRLAVGTGTALTAVGLAHYSTGELLATTGRMLLGTKY